MSKKQQEIEAYLRSVETATIADIYKNVSFTYYHNADKYVGEMLSRMIKSGKVERIKPGVFKWRGRQGIEDVNQLNLF